MVNNYARGGVGERERERERYIVIWKGKGVGEGLSSFLFFGGRGAGGLACFCWGFFQHLIHMSIIWICVMSCLCLAGWLTGWPVGQPTSLCGKNLNVGHYTQTVQPDLFMPAMFIGTIDFYHFIPLSLTLNLPWNHKVSMKQNLLASVSPTLFIWSGWNLVWWLSNSSLML